MKILIIHNRYLQFGGEDATFETETKLLQDHGHDVKTIIFDNKEIQGVADKLKLGYQLFYNRNSARTVDGVIKAFKPDIIHVHNFFYQASPSVLLAAKKNNIPLVVTVQNYRLICPGGLLMRNSKPCELCIHQTFPLAGVRYSCHRSSHVQTAHLTLVTAVHKLNNTWNDCVTRYITVTEFGRSKYINSSLRLLPEKVVVKPSSVAEVSPAAFDERDSTFLFIGRLANEKGIEVLLEAFKKSSHSIDIIGDGPLRPLVEATATNHPGIKFHGFKDRTFIISRLKKCRALVFPSLWYECLPVTILEAFSTGTPVIISNLGNLNEIVTDNYNGLHFMPNDADDLNRVVQKMSGDPEDQRHLYINARKTYLDKYTHEGNYNNLISIYQAAISSSSSDKPNTPCVSR